VVPLGCKWNSLSAAPALLGLVAGFALARAPRAAGWTATGDALDLEQRDLRVHDVFSASGANTNKSPDSNFPGALGAPLAIWKAAVEWGSERHGGGGGDPSQLNGLGSGAANYDPSWQGLASGPGGPNDNVHAPLSGSAPGVYAFCETPTSDGWRIRYYQGWQWHGGPGLALAPGEIDLQGVATHEHGHALGLGHSSAAGSTMLANATGSLLGLRSIESDDVAGIAAIYGTKVATKPRVLGSELSGTQVVLHGLNFAAGGNEVWFTRRSGGDGTPVVVPALASTHGGTRITLTLPVAAGPGDVLVRRPGSAHACLSNAWPFDTDHPGTSGGPIAIAGVVPVNLWTVAANPQSIVLSGSGFASATAVAIDGVALAAGAWSTAGDSTLTIQLSNPMAPGMRAVEVTNPLGTSAPLQVSVLPPTLPALALSSPISSSAKQLHAFVGAEPGSLVWLCASSSAEPTSLAGIVDLAIGAGGQSLFLLNMWSIDAAGSVTFSFQFSGLPFGTPIHLQAAVLPVGSALPLAASNAATTIFYF